MIYRDEDIYIDGHWWEVVEVRYRSGKCPIVELTRNGEKRFIKLHKLVAGPKTGRYKRRLCEIPDYTVLHEVEETEAGRRVHSFIQSPDGNGTRYSIGPGSGVNFLFKDKTPAQVMRMMRRRPRV